jgi:hypothetical protein
MRRISLIALLALAASGCGTSAKEKADLGQARAVVERFAAAHDASACDLLTNFAVKTVYGNFTAKPARARANCAKKAKGFKGEQVTVVKTSLLDDLTAKVSAHSADGKFTYSVNLRRKGPKKPWRIDQITQAKLAG